MSASNPLHAAYFLRLALASATRLQDFTAVEELTARALERARDTWCLPAAACTWSTH